MVNMIINKKRKFIMLVRQPTMPDDKPPDKFYIDNLSVLLKAL